MAASKTIELANQQARALQGTVPRALSARYDRKTGRVVIDLSSKLTVSFLPQDAEGLQNARPSQLEEIEISPSGFGLHFPRLDADVYVPGLLEGLLGTKQWMASRLGQAGGQSRSRAKRAAAKANGKLGGRPRKAVAARKTSDARRFAIAELRSAPAGCAEHVRQLGGESPLPNLMEVKG